MISGSIEERYVCIYFMTVYLISVDSLLVTYVPISCINHSIKCISVFVIVKDTSEYLKVKPRNLDL